MARDTYFRWRADDENRIFFLTQNKNSVSQVPVSSDHSNLGAEIARQKTEFDRSIKAARAGDTAQFLPVAAMYTAGAGIGKDDAKALFWIQKAESAGLTEAKYNLALLYAEGGAVGQDLQKSYDYLNEYIQAGNTSSKTAELTETIKQRVGSHGFSCMTYGFRQGTPNYSQCLMQTAQAERLAHQQAQLAQQQALFAKQQYELQAEQYRRQIAAEKLAAEQAAKEQRERDRAKLSEELFKLSEDLLCPKKPGGGIFREPVAGCGRNKNEPRSPAPLTQIQICRAANPRNPEACH
jgi:hypothetical protein